MAAQLGYPVYDADNHLYEPQEALLSHLPRRFKKDVQYVQVNGRTKLALCGQISDYIPNPTFDVVAPPGVHEKWYRGQNSEGLSMRELSGTPEKCRDAYRAPEPRLRLMDEQGLDATLMFPTLASAIEERMSHDHELVHAVIHSLNEWILEVWGFVHRGRIFSTPIVTLMDVDMAVAELEFCLKHGARTVLVRPAPVPGYRGSRSFGLPHFDPFWARVAEAGIFVSMHASDSGYDRIARMWQGGSEFRPFEPDPFKLMLGFSSRAISDSISALVCHGVFDRHPKVRVASIENGCNWMKTLVSRFNHVYGQMPKEFKRHPIETLQRHIFVSPFYEEPIREVANLVGVSQILFGSDFPHPEGLAEPVEFLKELVDFGPEDQRRIMGGNLKALLDGASLH
jgi:predicted TIM-barrel fold metal-dependent hydrolase